MDFKQAKLKRYLLLNDYEIQSGVYNDSIFYKYPIKISFFDKKIELKDILNNRKFNFEYKQLPIIKKFINYIEKDLMIA